MRLRIPTVIAFGLLIAACQIRVDTTVTINADESGSFAIEMSVDEEFRELGEYGFDVSEGTEDLPPDWTVEPFVDGEFEGVRISTDFADLDDLNTRLRLLSESAEDEESGSPADMFSGMSVTHEGDTFSFHTNSAGIADDLASTGDEGFEGLDPSTIFDTLFQIRLIVTLPGEVVDHNADALSGSTMTWDVSVDDERTEFFASSSASGGEGLNPIVLVVGVVAVAGLVLWALSRRNDDTTSAISDYEPAVEA